MRAIQRAATRPGHGLDQRADDRRRRSPIPSNEIAKLVAGEKDDAKLVDEIFLRILNRPGDAGGDRAVPGRDAVDRRRPPASWPAGLAEREAEFADHGGRSEQQRQAAIAAASSELAAYETADRPASRRAGEGSGSTDRRGSKPSCKDYEATLPQRLAAWEKQVQRCRPLGRPLDPTSVSAPRTDATLTRQPDRSIVAAGNGKATITVVGRNRADRDHRRQPRSPGRRPRCPSKGPGRAPDGNFVLNEFRVTCGTQTADPKQTKPVALQNALADFSQDGFDVKLAIDGKRRPQQGWAVSPRTA